MSTIDGEANSSALKEEEKVDSNPGVVVVSNNGEETKISKPIIEKMDIDDDTKPVSSSEAATLSSSVEKSTSSSVNSTSEEKEAIEETKPKETNNNTPAAIEPVKSNITTVSEVKATKSSEDKAVAANATTTTAATATKAASEQPTAAAVPTSTKPTKSTSTASSSSTTVSSTEKAPPSLGTKNPAAVATSGSVSSSASAARKKKQEKGRKISKKRKAVDVGSASGSRRGSNEFGDDSSGPKKPGPRKGKKKKKTTDRENEPSGKKTLPSMSKAKDVNSGGKTKKSKKGKLNGLKHSPAQAAVEDMMRQLLEEDKYSQKGSIVETDSSDDEDDERTIFAIASGTASSSKRGTYGADATISMLRLDRATITRAMRKRLRIEEMRGVMDTSGVLKKRANSVVLVEDNNDNGVTSDDGKIGDTESGRGGGRKKKRKKAKRTVRAGVPEDGTCITIGTSQTDSDEFGFDKGGQFDGNEDDMGADESSIFGQTTGSSNSTWVECDKCGKWRRLRGVVDAKKLPAKWYCSMNKTDPERARCSAPEEEYEAQNTPENATDQRTRKHLRLWVRRLQCNENYESKLPTMTRGKRRNTATSAKEPYEWVRCCNPSCGKWRSLLKSMDASSVIEAANNGEWYCVLNTWDEKTASCAAPQENLPAIGCPPWVRVE